MWYCVLLIRNEEVAKLAGGNLARKQIYIPATKPELEISLRVAAYCRVSTDSDDQRNSFAAQNTHYLSLIHI